MGRCGGPWAPPFVEQLLGLGPSVWGCVDAEQSSNEGRGEAAPEEAEEVNMMLSKLVLVT